VGLDGLLVAQGAKFLRNGVESPPVASPTNVHDEPQTPQSQMTAGAAAERRVPEVDCLGFLCGPGYVIMVIMPGAWGSCPTCFFDGLIAAGFRLQTSRASSRIAVAGCRSSTSDASEAKLRA
jgi:hypothetical protein